MVRELTVLDQSQVRACWAPLKTQVLATADGGAVCACDLVKEPADGQPDDARRRGVRALRA
ncbi:MAG TPA: hypothetical protein VFT75_10375 [Nocardioidaceae bacterium]|jgi:hypothetical protein|nr:hypothetical protein [Nocardioidaceae bacterium]